MNKVGQNILVCFFVISSTFCFGITSEELSALIIHADTPDSERYAKTQALANPQLLEEIIFYPRSKIMGWKRLARINAIQYLKICALNEAIEMSRFFSVICRFLRHIPELSDSDSQEFERSCCEESISGFGYNYFRPEAGVFNGRELIDITLLYIIPEMINNGLLVDSPSLGKLKASMKLAKEHSENKTPEGKKNSTNCLETAFLEATQLMGNKATASAGRIIGKICKNTIVLLQKE